VDPITAAIVAALSTLGSEAAKEGVKSVVRDAYDGLKAVIRRKWGGDSAVAKSVDAVEAKPASQGLAIDLSDEVAKTGAANDAEVLQALKSLTDALAKAAGEKAPTKSVTITAANVGVGNIDAVSGGTFNIGAPAAKS
jgi:hypothetical protein